MKIKMRRLVATCSVLSVLLIAVMFLSFLVWAKGIKESKKTEDACAKRLLARGAEVVYPLFPRRTPIATLVDYVTQERNVLHRVVFVRLEGIKVDEEIAQDISRLDELEVLSMERSGFRAEHLTIMRLEDKPLDHLDLKGTRLSDEIARAVANCNSLRELFAVETEIGTNAVCILAGMTRLRKLVIGPNISLTELKCLSEARSLEELVVVGSDWSSAELGELRRLIPNVSIRLTD